MQAIWWLASTVAGLGAIALGAMHWDKVVLFGYKLLATAFGLFTKKYSARKVETQASDFVNNKLFSHVAGMPEIAVKVNWVSTAEDARLYTDGKLIVRMRRDRDDGRNTLSAVWVAARHTFWPAARPWLDKRMLVAIDLEIIRILSRMLGKGARHHYTQILAPQTHADPELVPLLRLLYETDEGGLFRAVLIQEMMTLDEILEHQPPRADLREEGLDFLRWIHAHATREPGDDSTELAFYGKHIKLAIILLSKAATVAQGTYPYERRLGMAILNGARNVYLLGVTAGQSDWCDQVAARFATDPRVQLKTSTFVTRINDKSEAQLPFVHFVRNELAVQHASYSEQVAALGIGPGVRVNARVRSMSDTKALCLVEEALDATMAAKDVAWGYRGLIDRFLTVDAVVPCQVSEVSSERNLLVLSRKAVIPSPWAAGIVPAADTTCLVQIIESYSGGWVVRPVISLLGPHPEFFGIIPRDEWSWFDENTEAYVAPLPGSTHKVRLLHADQKRDEVAFSRRALEGRDFGAARSKYPNNTVAMARVTRVEYGGLLLELEPGIFGRIPRQRVQSAGFELENFEQTVVPGQRFSCIVVGARVNRGYLQMDLQRNQS
jgi:hypothetical protein